jgi:hypothetical protein
MSGSISLFQTKKLEYITGVLPLYAPTSFLHGARDQLIYFGKKTGILLCLIFFNQINKRMDECL